LRPYGTFSHPNSMAGYFLVLYILILTNKIFRIHTIARNILLFICTLIIMFSFSKIAIVTCIFISTLYLIRNSFSCKICVFSRIFILSIIGLIFISGHSDPLTIQKRLDLILNSIQIIKQHILFGTGIGAYLVEQNKFSSNYEFFFNQPVHNIFLLTIGEFGIILSGYVSYLIYKIYKKNKTLLIPHLLLLSVIFITGFFDHYWITLQQNFLLLGLVGGYVLKKTI
ncbi:MAG: hypothetical protein Q7R95_02895, partial [bacterium]|nr:hypothetical protein [bacterium]